MRPKLVLKGPPYPLYLLVYLSVWHLLNWMGLFSLRATQTFISVRAESLVVLFLLVVAVLP